MTLHRGLLNWGVFLIVLAAVPLAVQTGHLDAAAAAGLLRLWPLILIGIGLGLILRFTPLHPLGGLLAAGTLGLLVGALLAGGVGSIGGACVGDAASPAGPERSGPFGGAQANVQLELTCVELGVVREAGGQWRLRADMEGEEAPRLDASAQRLSLRSASSAPFFLGNQRRSVELVLPADAPFDMSLTLNAAQAEIDLADGPVGSLNATLNASDAGLRLGASEPGTLGLNMTLNAASGRIALGQLALQGNLTLNASSLDMCVPSEAGLRVDFDDTLSSANFESAGLSRSGDVWQSASYESAATQVELNINANVSSITLERTGDCP